MDTRSCCCGYNATNNEIEDKIVEATISNWFEDKDASSDKVWEYFRVI